MIRQEKNNLYDIRTKYLNDYLIYSPNEYSLRTYSTNCYKEVEVMCK